MVFIIFSIINYIVGSIPFALVIGKLFYHKDIRKEGSGNLGATNAGRVLGTKAAISVALLDGLKGCLLFLAESSISRQLACCAIIFVCIGHCFPLFASFKGGKAVATTYGIILAISFESLTALLFVFCIPLIIWFIIKIFSQYVSLGSIISILISAVISTYACYDYHTSLAITLCWILIVIKHKDNIARLINGTENKANY